MTDWFDEGGSARAVDIGVLMDSKVPDCLWRLVEAGALVSLGKTSDGGAMGVTVTLDGRWRRQYFREPDEACDWLSEAADFIEREVARTDASSGRRKRSRGRQTP